MKKIRYIIFLTALLLTTLSAQAQKAVSGVVTDQQKMPVIGATVIVKGSTIGTTTDMNGAFNITLPNDKEAITISFMGYGAETIVVGNQSKLNVVLKDAANELDEVVVVGYGMMRKSDLTGSVTSVKIDENEAARTGSFDQLLQGRAAGVQVTSNSFAPGAAVDIKIRGNSSFNGGGEPLYVVDGVILNPPSQNEGKLLSKGTANDNSDTPTNGLLGINPQDIANMEILKDASATAIYGAMGANGVVLITTKQGVSERPTVTWTSGVDISTPSKRIDMMNLDQFIEFQNYRFDNQLTTSTTELGRIFIDPLNQSLGYKEGIEAVDWQDYCLRNSISQRHRISVSGRSKSSNYLIAAGYSNSKGIIKNTGVEQIDARLNYDKTLSKYFKIGTRTSIAQIKMDMTQGTDASQNSSASSMIRSMVSSRPYYNFYNEASMIEDPEADPDNLLTSGPPMWLRDFNDHSTEYRVTPSFYLQFTPLTWFTYKLSIGGDYRSRDRGKWKGPLINSSAERAIAGIGNMRNIRYNIDNMFMFNKTFAKVHRLSGTIGTTFTRSMNRNQIIEGWNIEQYFPQDFNINSAPNTRYAYSEAESAILSFLARAVYSYKDKYVFTATYRIDGSSKFAKENRYSYFPSFALAWRVTEEKWLRLPKEISTFKVRLGWGRVGNEALSPYQTLSTFTAGANNMYPDHTLGNTAEGVIGISPTALANKSLKWETTEQYNAGVDLGFFNNRLTVTVDLYDKYTKDLLQQVSIPGTAGFGSMWINRGEIRNRGIEFAVDAQIIAGKNFSWNFGANASINRNKIINIGLPVSVAGMQPFFYGKNIGSSNYFRSPANIFMEGQAMGMFYGYKTDGLVQQGETGPSIDGKTPMMPGGIKYVLNLKDGEVRDTVDPNKDRTIIGNPNPDLVFGFNTAFDYKNFSLSMNFNGVLGVDIVNVNRMVEEDIARNSNIRPEAFYDMWSPSNPNAKYPSMEAFSAGETQYFTDRLIEDGSFLRLSNVTLNYNIPMKKNKYIRSIGVSATVANAFVITKYKGWDPEVNSYGRDMFRMGVDNGSYPNARTYSLGLSLNF